MHTKSSVKLTPPVSRPALSSPDPRWNNRPETNHLRYEGPQPNFKATHYCNKCLKDTAPGLSVPLDRLPSNVTIPTSACVSNGQHCWIPKWKFKAKNRIAQRISSKSYWDFFSGVGAKKKPIFSRQVCRNVFGRHRTKPRLCLVT